MRTRKFNLILVSLFFLSMLVGCTNDAAQYSGGYLQSNTVRTDITSEKQENNVNYSINTEPTQENTSAMKSTTNQTGITTNVETSKDAVTKVISDETTIAVNTEINEVTDSTTYVASNVETEESIVTEVMTNVPTNPDIPTTQPVPEPTTQPKPNVPNDSLVIKDVVINLAYGDSTQDMVDNNDAVYDTGYISNKFNTAIFGHSFKGFSILDSMVVGEKFAMNNNGEVKYFEVQKSGLAVLNEYHSDATYEGETEGIFYTDFGYHGLILITCDKQDPDEHRWIVIAKEIIE